MGLEPTTVGATIRSYHQLSYAHHPNLHNMIILKSALYNRFPLQKQGETHVVCEFFQACRHTRLPSQGFRLLCLLASVFFPLRKLLIAVHADFCLSFYNFSAIRTFFLEVRL